MRDANGAESGLGHRGLHCLGCGNHLLMLVLAVLWALWLAGFTACAVPWCLLQDAQMSQGASARSLTGDLPGTSQAAGGARVGEELSPGQRRELQERPTEEGVLKLRRWAAKGQKGR